MKHRSKKLKAASYSIYANAGLILLKVVAAIMTASIAIIAELVHSALDMIASLFAYLGIRKADEPADADHHYGHEKFENVSAFVQTILIVITSLFIIYEAGMRLMNPAPLGFVEIGLVVMLVTLFVDYFVSRYLHKISKKEGSAALESDAYHFTTDLWSVVAVVIGLGFVMLGLPVFDAIAAIIVALLMLWVAFGLAKKSISMLTDISPSHNVIKKIERAISTTPGVLSYHKLKARHHGNKIIADVHIQVRGGTSVKEGHRIAHDVKARIKKSVKNIKDVGIHIEPA